LNTGVLKDFDEYVYKVSSVLSATKNAIRFPSFYPIEFQTRPVNVDIPLLMEGLSRFISFLRLLSREKFSKLYQQNRRGYVNSFGD